MFISRSSLRVVKLLPLLFIFAFSIVCLTSKSTYAGNGYATRIKENFDGFLYGNPFYTNSWPQLNFYGNKNSYNGYTGNLPSLCMPQNSNTTSNCNSNVTQSGTNYNSWLAPVLSTPVNGYDIKGIERIYTSGAQEIPHAWKGHKVVISLALNFAEREMYPDGGLYYNTNPLLAELNWGAIEFINRGSSNTCNDVISNRMVIVDNVSNNDFVSFELDYTNVTPDMVCNIYPSWQYSGSASHGFAWYGNFSSSITAVVHDPYIGWDIVEDEEVDNVAGIIDEWKDQQGQEVEEIKQNAQNAGTAANGILSVFQFTVLDPLASFWSLFSDGSCVNIPIVGGLINMEGDKRVCSWWPASIRAITTPVFTSAGTLLLWGFVMKWLRDDGTMAEFSRDDNGNLYAGFKAKGGGS